MGIQQKYSDRTRYRVFVVLDVPPLEPVRRQLGGPGKLWDQKPTGNGQNPYGRTNDTELALRKVMPDVLGKYLAVDVTPKVRIEVEPVITETITREFIGKTEEIRWER